MLNEALATMAVGMGTVFCFLVILWSVVAVLGMVVGYLNKIFPEEVKTVQKAVQTSAGDLGVAIAIAAAKLRR